MGRRRFDRTALLRLLEQGLTRSQCAARLGVSRAAISQAINYDKRPLCIFVLAPLGDPPLICRRPRRPGSMYCAAHAKMRNAA